MIKGITGIVARRRALSTPDVTPPSAPTVSSTGSTSTTIALSWTVATDNVGVVGYDVYVNGAFKASSVTTTYNVTGLSPSTSYSIFVKARDAAANSTNSNTITPATTAVPSAPILEGFGADAAGANTATVYHVTVVGSATGPGSLAYGLGLTGGTNPTGKTIVFDVAGTITVRHHVDSNVNHVTIDGTTAPYPGISISTTEGDGIHFENASVHHIILKGITTFNCSNDGIAVNDGANHIAIMNCTSYGNHDGNIDVSADAAEYVTIQYCIIGNNHGHAEGNSGGSLLTGRYISFHHNLCFPYNNPNDDGERFPFVHRNYGVSAVAPLPDADVRNNLIWNWGRENASGSGFGIGFMYNAFGNAVNNYLRQTTAVEVNQGISLSQFGAPTGHAYIAGNVSGNGYNYNSKSDRTEFTVPAQYQLVSETACAAALKVLQYVGMTQRNPVGGTRNPIDAAHINAIPLPLIGC